MGQLCQDRGDYGRMANLNDQFAMHTESRVLEGFDDRHVRVLKVSILPNEYDGDRIKQSLLAVKIMIKMKQKFVNIMPYPVVIAFHLWPSDVPFANISCGMLTLSRQSRLRRYSTMPWDCKRSGTWYTEVTSCTPKTCSEAT
jgi:hypothetical protein